MSNKPVLTIYLFDLPAKESAVFQRVIAFSARKGRHYQQCNDIDKAQLVIMNHDIETCENAKQQGALKNWLLIENGESARQDLAHKPHIFSIKRPLLVTRVMRELDKIAKKQLSKPPIAAEKPKPVVQAVSITPSTMKVQSQPLPIINTERQNPTSKTDIPVQDQNINVIKSQKMPIKARYHALIVDDSFAIRKQLELELRDANISTDFAEDGEICLEKTAQQHYDLVFLDIVMPGIDGYEVCKRLRAKEAWKKTPIIMLSGKTSPMDEVQGVLAGCSTYLTKPVKSPALQKVLKRVTQWIDHFTENINPKSVA